MPDLKPGWSGIDAVVCPHILHACGGLAQGLRHKTHGFRTETQSVQSKQREASEKAVLVPKGADCTLGRLLTQSCDECLASCKQPRMADAESLNDDPQATKPPQAQHKPKHFKKEERKPQVWGEQ